MRQAPDRAGNQPHLLFSPKRVEPSRADAGVEKVAPFVGIVHPAEKCNELGFVFAPSHGCEPLFEPCAVPYVVRPECVGQEPGIRCVRPGTLGLAVRVTGHHAEIVDVVRPVVIGIGFERIGLVKVIAHLGRAVVIAQDAVSRFPAHVFARFVVLVVRRERCHDLQPRYRTERGGDVARIVEPFAAVIHLREHGHGVVGPHALVFEKFAVSAVDGSRGVVYHCLHECAVIGILHFGVRAARRSLDAQHPVEEILPEVDASHQLFVPCAEHHSFGIAITDRGAQRGIFAARRKGDALVIAEVVA